MKRSSIILPLLMVLTSVASCSVDYEDHCYNDASTGHDKDTLSAPLSNSDMASIYGTVNGDDRIMVMATGDVFYVAYLPDEIFLAPFPGGSVYTYPAESVPLMLYDNIYYTIEELSADGLEYKLHIPEHTMNYKVKQGDDIHLVAVTFAKTEGSCTYVEVGNKMFWRYSFTLTMAKMTSDGNEVNLTGEKELNYEFYYNRLVFANLNKK